MSPRWFLAGLLAMVVVWGLWVCRRQSPLHLMVLALLATWLAGTFHPLVTLWVEPLSWRNLERLSEDVLLGTQADYLAYALGLLCACLAGAGLGWLARGPDTRQVRDARARTAQRDRILAFGLLLGGAALYLVYAGRVGLETLQERSNYGEKYLASVGLGPFAFGLPLMIAGCLWAEGSELCAWSKLPFRLAALAIALWSLAFISVRSNAVILLVGALALYCQRSRLELRRVHPGLVLLLLVSWAGLESFSLFRGAFQGDLREALHLMAGTRDRGLATLAGGSELSHPFITAMEVRSREEPASLLGQSYVRAAECLLPLAVHADRPLTLSESFARHNYSALAAQGGGTAFSLVAEAWLNFGPLIGPGLIGLVMGLACLWAEARRARHAHGIAARLLPFLMFVVVIQHRSESASILKYAVSVLLPVCALLVLAQMAWRTRARHGRGGAFPVPHPRVLRPRPRRGAFSPRSAES